MTSLRNFVELSRLRQGPLKSIHTTRDSAGLRHLPFSSRGRPSTLTFPSSTKGQPQSSNTLITIYKIQRVKTSACLAKIKTALKARLTQLKNDIDSMIMRESGDEKEVVNALTVLEV